jgi:hypothetical protein
MPTLLLQVLASADIPVLLKENAIQMPLGPPTLSEFATETIALNTMTELPHTQKLDLLTLPAVLAMWVTLVLPPELAKQTEAGELL